MIYRVEQCAVDNIVIILQDDFGNYRHIFNGSVTLSDGTFIFTGGGGKGHLEEWNAAIKKLRDYDMG